MKELGAVPDREGFREEWKADSADRRATRPTETIRPSETKKRRWSGEAAQTFQSELRWWWRPSERIGFGTQCPQAYEACDRSRKPSERCQRYLKGGKAKRNTSETLAPLWVRFSPPMKSPRRRRLRRWRKRTARGGSCRHHRPQKGDDYPKMHNRA